MRATRFCTIAGLTALLGLGGCDGMAQLVQTGGGLFGGAAAGEGCPAAAGEEDRSCRAEEQAQAFGSPAPESAVPGSQTPRSQAIVKTPLYCYRTLAAITCYDSPDPQASPSRRVQ